MRYFALSSICIFLVLLFSSIGFANTLTTSGGFSGSYNFVNINYGRAAARVELNQSVSIAVCVNTNSEFSLSASGAKSISVRFRDSAGTVHNTSVTPTVFTTSGFNDTCAGTISLPGPFPIGQIFIERVDLQIPIRAGSPGFYQPLSLSWFETGTGSGVCNASGNIGFGAAFYLGGCSMSQPTAGICGLSADPVFTAGVLIGPNGSPAAVGSNNNDDYTNKSVLGAIPGTGTLASGATIDFVNTIQNTGVIPDTFNVTVPSSPSGWTVQVSLDCSSYSASVTTGTIAANGTLNICVRVTVPAGAATYQGFSSVIQATSVTDATKSNQTIDRVYTGYILTSKTAAINNATGVGGSSDPVPGAVIIYSINYQNITSQVGSGNVNLTASNFVITENGSLAPNNWATNTTQVVGSASDSLGGVITGDTAGSNLLTDTVASIAPGQSGTFSFRRRIN